jgi:hypothetical protein
MIRRLCIKRVIKAILATALSGGLLTSLCRVGLCVSVALGPAAGNAPPGQGRCRVTRHGPLLQLESAAFKFTLDVSDGLRGRAWSNLLTGRNLSLGLGSEVELDWDAADQRIWISGWKKDGDKRITHVFLPPEARDKRLTLTLGGFGLYDYSHIQVTINGKEVGERRATRRWREPGAFDFGPGSKAWPSLRFGQDNILAMRCQDAILRTERMDQLGEDLDLSGPQSWPAQFEQYLTVGVPLSSPHLNVRRVRDLSARERGEVRVYLESKDQNTQVVVTYRWNDKEPVLHKFVEVCNQGPSERRLMNLRLGNYKTDATVSEGEQGFPVYLDDEFFMSLAHPAGWAVGQDKQICLRQYPGRMIEPRGKFESMEAVMGAANTGQARQLFLEHLRGRSRRVKRGHDKPYAIYDTYGANSVDGQPIEDSNLSEQYILQMLEKFGQGEKKAGYRFDFCNTHFWADHNGDLERFDPKRFPHGLSLIKSELDKLGIMPGLWTCNSFADWSIGGNPVVGSTFTHDPAYENGLYGYRSLCRATDPVRTIYSTAFRHHIIDEGVRLIKCDGLMPICYNPDHPHLPGVYSTEAIEDAVVQAYKDWDAANPDVFIMLYWGSRSPWWLLHADTIFDSGLLMEGASPGPTPTLFERDGVTVRLDQEKQWRNDVPALGQDSLGIWLSDWGWNSHIGKERWQEGFVMDICRGSLLAQLWTSYDWLSSLAQTQLADFIALLRASPNCFANERPILGDVWKQEPYGYSCTDGKRAFLALNNCTWSDVSVPLELNPKWGLSDTGHWDIYRWYPSPAKLSGASADFGRIAAISLRPFEVDLLEIVPAGQPPSLERQFTRQPMPVRFSQSSRVVELTVQPANHEAQWLINGEVPPVPNGATLVVSVEVTRDGRPFSFGVAQSGLGCRALVGGIQVHSEPVVRDTGYPVSWQAWRVELKPSTGSQSFELHVDAKLSGSVKLDFKGHCIPAA